MTIYLLDTNLVSELVREPPNRGVMRWSQQTPDSMQYISSVTLGEIAFGANRLPSGRRRDDMLQWIERVLLVRFDGRILPFDNGPAWLWAQLRADRQRMGRPLPAVDAQIAAIALHHDATLVTRNVADFADTGVTLLDPWTAE